MFIEKEGNVKIELFIRKGGRGSVSIETSLDEVPEKDKGKYEKSVFMMRPLTWKQHNDIQRAATVNRGPGMGSELDWVMYKEKKLCAVLIGWDAKDKEGKPIPVNEENIFRLNFQVAEALLQEFDKATILGDEERKNS
jgi:hypothetical protein